MHLSRSTLALIRGEPVLAISLLCALLSAAFVPPSPAYLGYVDLRVLCLLFCLMTVVAGLQDCGLFSVLAQRLLTGRRPFRLVCVFLVLLPFFSSMLVTNDVALITFVPFALLILELSGRRDAVIRVVVLQTIAANLGSMATPVGNPQNLFLYTHFSLSSRDFFSLLLPLTAVSLGALLCAALWGGGGSICVTFPQPAALRQRRHLLLYLGLFALCLLSVFRVLHYALLTAAVVLALLLCAPHLLRKADYGLLCTFVCFFIFSGNLGQIPAVREGLSALLSRSALLCSVAASQLISNVPAAVLLSGLTQDWQGLLAGVDVGGMGTPVASLASLISLKFYLQSPHARPLAYLGWFTLANGVGLLLLLPVSIHLIS